MESTRRFTRIECNNQSSIEIGNVAVIQAKILNISLNGALFELKHELLFKRGERWQLRFKLPYSDTLVQIETEVMHSHENLVGMKFVHMDGFSMENLYRLLETKIADLN